jgi:uronate dehydrogenase
LLAAMTVPDLTYATHYAASRNARGWFDLAAGERLGYVPADDAERYAAQVAPEQPAPTDGTPQGGVYASPAYTLDRQR